MTTTIQAVKNTLSAARINTYVIAASNDESAALELYAWNAQVSGAFLTPLHICEVVVRNTVSETLESIYGGRWPWSQGFERSLTNPANGYNPRKDLQNSRGRAATTGQVISELKFVFWQKMFTARYDQRLWEQNLGRVLPNLDQAKTVGQLRGEIYDELEQIRKLRNRIAHHEPIFTRNLEDDFQKIVKLVEFRCQVTASWMVSNQQALDVIKANPLYTIKT